MGLSAKMRLVFFLYAGKRICYIRFQSGKFISDLVHFLKAFLRHSLVIDFKREYHSVCTFKTLSYSFMVCFVIRAVANMFWIDLG